MISSEVRQGIQDEFKETAAPMVQFLLTKFDFFSEIERVAVKHGLSSEQERDLAIETAMVTMGASDPEEYAMDIKNELKLDDEKTKALVTDIVDRIFTKMQQIQDRDLGEIAVELKAQVGQHLAEKDVLESTGLTLNETPSMSAPATTLVQPSSTEARATNSFKFDEPAVYNANDPYHEPLE